MNAAIWLFADDINAIITDTDGGALLNKAERVIIVIILVSKEWSYNKCNRGYVILTVDKNCPIRPQVSFNTINQIYTVRLNSWESVLQKH